MTIRRNKRNLKESLSDHASRVDQDHEVDLARSELYTIADHSVKLHDMLKNVSETEGLDADVQAKITQAAMLMDEVYHELEYSMKPEDFDLQDELGMDELGDEVDDMDPSMDMDIDPEIELSKPARSLESRSYKKKAIRESREHRKPRAIKEVSDYERKLSGILESGMNRIMNDKPKSRRLRENALDQFVKSGKGGLQTHGTPEQVTQLQKILKNAGFDPGPIDGIYGRGTASAVKQFQKKHGLTVDGDAGKETIEKMFSTGKPMPPVKQPTTRDTTTGSVDPKSSNRMQAGDQAAPTRTRQTSRGSRPVSQSNTGYNASTGGGF